MVQEVWLASRNLYLTKNQLWWKCCELEASEAYPDGLPEELSSRESLTGYGRPRYDTAGLHYSWSRLIETYSDCSLTFPSDKMIALGASPSTFRPCWRVMMSMLLDFGLLSCRRLCVGALTKGVRHTDLQRTKPHLGPGLLWKDPSPSSTTGSARRTVTSKCYALSWTARLIPWTKIIPAL